MSFYEIWYWSYVIDIAIWVSKEPSQSGELRYELKNYPN